MKLTKGLAGILVILSFGALAEDAPIELPSSVPVDVFKIEEGQRGLGYIGFTVTLELEDSYFEDKIGDVDFDSSGIIYSLPGEGELGILGEMFELSFTAGAVQGDIRNPSFTDNGKNYNNTYDQSGFYLGFRPSFSQTLSSSDNFELKSATTLHTFFYTLSGDFSVDDGSNSYRYDEDIYGFALKPTSIIQATYYPSPNLGLTFHAGLSTFVAVDWVFFDDGGFDEDDEVEFLASDITTVFGYDISYRFDNGSVFNLASVLSAREQDDSIETVIRYIYNY